MSITAAILKAASLKEKGFRASLYYLGEYVDDERLIEENVTQITTVAHRLGQAGLDVHLSVDPTQIGYTLSDEIGQQNALRIGQVISQQSSHGRNVLMLDMEDFSYVQKTLDLHTRLSQAGIPMAITIQAYLHRSEADIRQLMQNGASVRLVKGAFAEKKERALVRKADINRNYIHLAKLLLSPEAQERGVYPIFATHDEQMLEAIQPTLREYQWAIDSFEFEMLYGVRPPLQQRLTEDGYTVRLYLPFGIEWWPYTARRIGENPANALFIWQALRNN
jgi:proline dehydrogenase